MLQSKTAKNKIRQSKIAKWFLGISLTECHPPPKCRDKATILQVLLWRWREKRKKSNPNDPINISLTSGSESSHSCQLPREGVCKLFCKGTEGKYIKLCRLYDHFTNYSTPTLLVLNQLYIIRNKRKCLLSNKTLLTPKF